MAIVEYRGVELDVCPAGHGRWWDRDELRMLVERHGGTALEGLEEELAALPASGSGRPCPQGHGTWFDAGELAALLAARLDGEALRAMRAFLADFLEPAP